MEAFINEIDSSVLWIGKTIKESIFDGAANVPGTPGPCLTS